MGKLLTILAEIAIGVVIAFAIVASPPRAADRHPVSVKSIPGGVTPIKATRLDLVDEKGDAHVTIYIDGGRAKMDVKTGSGVKTLDLPKLADKLGNFF
jgi:hypothetical protein